MYAYLLFFVQKCGEEKRNVRLIQGRTEILRLYFYFSGKIDWKIKDIFLKKENLKGLSTYIYGEKYPEGIEEAIMRYMSRSASPVFLAQLEDMLHVEKMQNLPGTDHDKHPNWRRKIPVNLEDLSQDIAYIRCIGAIKKER